MTLTHQIVRVDSKDAVDKWAEIAIPPGARDPDPAHAQARRLDARARGDRRQGGDLGGRRRDRRLHRVGIPGYAPAVGAFAPGFLVDRFFFQSFDAPMARSELLLVSPAGDRAGAGFARRRAPARRRGSRSTARASPAFWRWACRSCSRSARRSPRLNTCPSVRASSGVAWRRWARYLGEEFHDALRASPELHEQARRLAEKVREGPGRSARWRRRWSTG